MPDSLTIALISDVFFGPDSETRLRTRLSEARAAGARLAVLPELATLPWVPATKNARDEDAEPPCGPLHDMQSRACAEEGIALLGGAIVRDEQGRRFNTCLLFDADGTHRHSYRKIHVPEEPGFWESSHYDADTVPPAPVDALGFSLGIQICSDVNRPAGTHMLAAQGAECILAPRSTEESTYWKWKPVFIANALTGCCYVLSVNRPGPEQDVPIGGPSIAVAPTGEVLLETTDPVGIVTIDRATLSRAREDYPGYLAIPSELYARGWSSIPSKPAHHSPGS